jgi:signal transduction histidine kinase
MHILRNAAEAIESKGIITISTQHKEGAIFISVRDNGKGIPGDQLPQIFDPRFTTKGNRYRLGLGLSTSFRIIEAHKGKITAESTVGKGTEFTIRIPV